MLRKLLFFALFLTSLQSHAVLEIRGLGGGVVIDNKSMNKYLGQQSIKEMYVIGIVGGEALLFPIPQFGLGVRYDWQGVKVNAAGQGPQEAQIATNRWSAIVKLRHHLKFAYLGLVGTLGFDHKPKITIKDSNNLEVTYEKATVTSGSGGVEAGFHIGPFTIGAETGIQDYLLREIKNDTTQASFDANLGGWYILLGLGFNF